MPLTIRQKLVKKKNRKKDLLGLHPSQEMEKVSPCLACSSTEKGKSELLGTLPARKGGGESEMDKGHSLL